MRTVRLSEEEIGAFLGTLPDWTRQGQTLSRTFVFASFGAAMAFVNKVAEASECADHHPDLDIRYDKVTVALTTHFLQALTANDRDMAMVCDALAEDVRQ